LIATKKRIEGTDDKSKFKYQECKSILKSNDPKINIVMSMVKDQENIIQSDNCKTKSKYNIIEVSPDRFRIQVFERCK
jgi:hypothetical protein